MADAGDGAIWDHAARNNYVVISKDGDFLHLANGLGAEGRLVWVRLGNCRKGALLAAVERTWARIESALRSG